MSADLTRLSAAVMAHPKREVMVSQLLGELDRPIPVVWDQINDRHDTGIRAMEAYDPSATHHLVIQDDVQPTPDLIAGIERALAHVPEGHPASFYMGKVQPFRSYVERAVKRADADASWIVMDGVYWGPAVAVPTDSIPALSDWFRSAKAQRIQNYDRRVSAYYEARKLACWYSWPSLVEHRGDESLVRSGMAIRHAHRFAGADVSAMSIDWSGAVVDMGRTAQLDRRRQQRARR